MGCDDIRGAKSEADDWTVNPSRVLTESLLALPFAGVRSFVIALHDNERIKNPNKINALL